MDPLMQAGRACLRRRARDFLRSKASVVEAMRRLGCTCEGFHELLVALGKTGASLGSVKRHLAEMRRERAFDEAEVLRLIVEFDSLDRAETLFAREPGPADSDNSTRQGATIQASTVVQAKRVEPGLAVTPSPAVSGGVAPEQTRVDKKGWRPRTHLGDLRPS